MRMLYKDIRRNGNTTAISKQMLATGQSSCIAEIAPSASSGSSSPAYCPRGHLVNCISIKADKQRLSISLKCYMLLSFDILFVVVWYVACCPLKCCLLSSDMLFVFPFICCLLSLDILFIVLFMLFVAHLYVVCCPFICSLLFLYILLVVPWYIVCFPWYVICYSLWCALSFDMFLLPQVVFIVILLLSFCVLT